MVGFPDAQLPEKHIVQGVIWILASVNQNMIHRFVESRNHPTQTDNLGSRTDDGENFHASLIGLTTVVKSGSGRIELGIP